MKNKNLAKNISFVLLLCLTMTCSSNNESKDQRKDIHYHDPRLSDDRIRHRDSIAFQRYLERRGILKNSRLTGRGSQNGNNK